MNQSRKLLERHQLYSDSQDKYEKLVAILIELSTYLNEVEGVAISARSKSITSEQLFKNMSDHGQNEILQNLINQYDLYVEAVSDGQSLKNNKEMFRRFSEKNNISTPDEVLKIIDKHECLEVYNLVSTQSFRSINFFKYCSHSLEDLTLRPYWELYQRTKEINEMVISAAAAILGGKRKTPHFDFIPKHTVKEISSDKNLITTVLCRVLSPIYDIEDGYLMGMIHLFDVEKHYEMKVVR